MKESSDWRYGLDQPDALSTVQWLVSTSSSSSDWAANSDEPPAPAVASPAGALLRDSMFHNPPGTPRQHQKTCFQRSFQIHALLDVEHSNLKRLVMAIKRNR